MSKDDPTGNGPASLLGQGITWTAAGAPPARRKADRVECDKPLVFEQF
jgi:hypothetical protein